MMSSFNTQPTLENEFIKIVPLKEEDFEILYAIASDPLIWEQHPNKDRYKREVFETFFRGAMASKGAFLVYDTKSGKAIGSSRYYEADPEHKTIVIGYTFLARDHWGGIYNPALKALMLEYAFTSFDAVLLHIGAHNLRSQKAAERIGAKKIGELEMAYYGEANKLNFVYEIRKADWLATNHS